MTVLYITIDTEYSSGLALRCGGAGRAENFARSIACDTPDGPVGVAYQMDIFDAHGLKGVFFVDPMPALVWGVEAVADVVGPIVARGHDVQLHLHSEWLTLAGPANPLKGRTGGNLKDFAFEEQCRLLDHARATLMAAGAPRPIAFRAGNYGANDDTLRALAELGIAYDTSHCPGFAGSACGISLGPRDRQVQYHGGVIEVPIGAIEAHGGGLRHYQVTALTYRELIAAARHARDEGQPSLTLVSHSFELMSRDRLCANRIVKRRFDRFCAALAALPGVRTATYAEARPAVSEAGIAPLPHSLLRTGRRLVEQALSNVMYGGT